MRTLSSRSFPSFTATLLLGLLLLIPFVGVNSQCQAAIVYLGLGDSITFGFDPSTPASLTPSIADQGFVKPLVDHLATLHGGVRPEVRNLAIPGELMESFFTGQPPAGWVNRVPQLNLNYTDPNVSQRNLMVSTIQSIRASGDTIGYASVLFGSNDIFYLVATEAFQQASGVEQQQLLGAKITEVLTSYQSVLSELTTLAPEARILLPNYYNPFPAGAAEQPLYEMILNGFNPGVAQLATAFGAEYVDLYSAIDGRQLELTNIAAGDVHPNQAGYQALSGAFISAIPEPTSLLLMSFFGGLLCLRRPARRTLVGRSMQ